MENGGSIGHWKPLAVGDELEWEVVELSRSR
jgi:hypothetical protein